MSTNVPWIANVSKLSIESGKYDVNLPEFDSNKTILIRILDPSYYFEVPAQDFEEVHKFSFFDTNQESDPDSITDEDAEQISDILKNALDKGKNVIVHCTAGRCRSGAVVEVGTVLGFKDLDIYRQPNIVVKSKLLRALGLSY